MLMQDKNGKEIKTGDIVRIEGGYFKADNGTFVVTRSPGDPSWMGKDYCLKKCKKSGEESKSKHSTAFWPLMVTVNSYDKRMVARQHNAEHAKIEIVGAVEIYDLLIKQVVGLNDHEYRELVPAKRYRELLAYERTTVEVLNIYNAEKASAATLAQS